MSDILSSKIQVSVSKEHAKQTDAVRKVFGDLPVNVSADHWRLSEGGLTMQVTIFLGGAFLGGAAWDLLKLAIKKLREEYPKSGIAIRNQESILFVIRPDQTVNTVVVPERVKEFQHIKTLNDLISYLRQDTGWSPTKLRDCATISRGGSPRPIVNYITDDPDGLNWLRIGDIDRNSKYIEKTSEKIKKEGLKKTTMVHVGDLILSNSMSFGRPFILKTDTCIHDGWLALKKIKQEISRDFLYYLLSSEKMQYTFQSMAAGSGVQNLKKETVKDITVNLPPLPEQKRIVAVLETCDKAIDLFEKKIELKDQLKKGLMQQLLTGKKRLPGFSDDWDDVKLDKLGKTHAGLSGKNKSHFGEGKPFISYMNVYSNTSISLDELPLVDVGAGEKQFIAKYGDLFFTTSSETPSEVGMSSVLLNKMNGPLYLNSFCFAFRLSSFDTILPEFARYYFRGEEFRKKMTRIAQGASRFNLSKKYFIDTKIHIPLVEEQKAVAQVLSSADQEIDLLKTKLQEVRKQKKYLLNNLITGKIRTPEDMNIPEHA